MAGPTGGPHLTCYCTFTDDTSKFYATTNCEGYTPYNADASPQKWWQYIDYPAGDKWSVKPVMILGNGTGRTVPQAEYDDYINTDIQRSQFAVTNYLKATWTEKSVWSGSWDNWNIYGDGDFSQDEQIWDADTGYQLTGWSYPKRVSAIFPTVTDTTCSVEYLKFDFEEKVPVEIPSSQWWDETEVDSGITKWDDSQTRQYNIQFLIEVSEDKVNWTTVGKAPSWTILKDDTKGNAAEIEPTTWTAGVTKYVRLTPINDGPTGPLIRGVMSVDGSSEVFQVTPQEWERMSRTSGFKYNKQKYYWIVDGYIYLPNVSWSTISLEAMFEGDITGYKCDDPCTFIQSEAFDIPSELLAIIEDDVVQRLANREKINMDLQPSDKQSTIR